MRVALVYRGKVGAGAGAGGAAEGFAAALRASGLDVVLHAPRTEGAAEWTRILGDLELGGAFDLLHSLDAVEPLELASLIAVPFVLTLDGAVAERTVAVLQSFRDRVTLVADDEDHRHPDLTYAASLAPGAAAVSAWRDLYEKAVADWARSARRPWGYYKVLEDTLGHKVKRIVVYPGEALSLQLHHRRAEHWTVVAGEALVTRDEQQIRLRPGESIDIPRGAKHSIECVSARPLAFIEVQHGDYFGEDDIVRFKDRYGRAD